jgi:hypothetical protein
MNSSVSDYPIYLRDPDAFDLKYADTMQRLWSHPANNQRPAVLNWLKNVCPTGLTVSDIGAGDAYYFGQVAPARYTLVEPNTALRAVAESCATHSKVPCVSYRSVGEFLRCERTEDYQIHLVIHALLYFEVEEVSALLRWLRGRHVLIVHPHADTSTTIGFEHSCGIKRADEKVRLKEQLLGSPRSRHVHPTHLRMPLTTDPDSLAFLVAHRTGRKGIHADVFCCAREFVRDNLSSWRKPDYFELPQYQVMEEYY